MLTERDVTRGVTATAIDMRAPALPVEASNLNDLEAICGRPRSRMLTMFGASPTPWRQVADVPCNPRPVDLVPAGDDDAGALCKMRCDAKLFPPLAIVDFITHPADEDKLSDWRMEAIRLVPAPYNGPWPTPHMRHSRIERLVQGDEGEVPCRKLPAFSGCFTPSISSTTTKSRCVWT